MEITTANDRLGSLKYAAPETRDDPRTADELSDVFSLGILTYEVLLGKNIFGNLRPLEELVPGVPTDISTFAYIV